MNSDASLALRITAAIAVLLALVVVSGWLQSNVANAVSGGEEMVLNIPGGDCDDPVRPTECDVAVGSKFYLTVDAVTIPADGYVLVEAWVEFGENLVYTPSANAIDEVLWPDCDPGIAVHGQITVTAMNVGCISGTLPPLPVSTYVGSLFQISLSCPDAVGSHTVELRPYGDPRNPQPATTGAQFIVPPDTRVIPKVDEISVNCIDPAAVGGVAVGGALKAMETSDSALPRPNAFIALGFALGILAAGAYALRSRLVG